MDPAWQQWLRDHQPPALITWGRNDPFFPEPGVTALNRSNVDAADPASLTGAVAGYDAVVVGTAGSRNGQAPVRSMLVVMSIAPHRERSTGQ
jgi:hypothetical protein